MNRANGQNEVLRKMPIGNKYDTWLKTTKGADSIVISWSFIAVAISSKAELNRRLTSLGHRCVPAKPEAEQPALLHNCPVFSVRCLAGQALTEMHVASGSSRAGHGFRFLRRAGREKEPRKEENMYQQSWVGSLVFGSRDLDRAEEEKGRVQE